MDMIIPKLSPSLPVADPAFAKFLVAADSGFAECIARALFFAIDPNTIARIDAPGNNDKFAEMIPNTIDFIPSLRGGSTCGGTGWKYCGGYGWTYGWLYCGGYGCWYCCGGYCGGYCGG